MSSHRALNKPLTPDQATLGELVIITKPDSENVDKVGEICKIRNYGERVRLSVEIDDHIYSFSLEDLTLA